MKFSSLAVFSFASLVFSPLTLSHEDHKITRANTHAPIGVMGDHLHKEGEWMFSLRTMQMAMEGLSDGSDEISNADYFSSTSYMLAPQAMDMTMVMMGFMYAPSDNLTLMLGIPYVENAMGLKTRMGMDFDASSYDMGDLKVTALLRSVEGQTESAYHKLHFNLALSLPTGGIDHTGITPMSMGMAMPLPYPMQIGAGSYVSTLGATYNGGTESNSMTWGAQLTWSTPLNQNNFQYKIGDRTKANLWAAYGFNDSLSLSARFQYDKSDNYEGRHPRLMAMMVPTADPNKRAFERMEFFVGLNFAFNDSALNGHRLALEWGAPLSEDLDGPALQVSDTLLLGWQKAL